jgi:hypothetical protein|tara:strand:+ start:490553 stop:490654 length:102 start_codon:yes stop_codon:yes gene_type:complete
MCNDFNAQKNRALQGAVEYDVCFFREEQQSVLR